MGAFRVTCWHKLAGEVSDYCVRCDGFGTFIRPGAVQMDWIQHLMINLQTLLTNLPNPKLMSDWSHVLPEHTRHLHTELMNDLQEISSQINDLNSMAPSE